MADDTSEAAHLAQWFRTHRHRPPLLRDFLQAMPKGADLHTHLIGAVYAESYLAWAREQGLCAQLNPGKIVQCTAPGRGSASSVVPMDSVMSTSSLYRKMIDALSVRNLEKYRTTGREQFFATFNRFGAVYRDQPLRKGDALAELVRRAASQNVQHVEVIINDSHGRADSIASTVSYTKDWSTLRSRLLDAGLRSAVQQGRTFLTQAEQRADSLLNCGTSPTPTACTVTRRYRMYAVRVGSPLQVFARLLYAVERARADSRVEAVDLVAPEDHRIALRDYDLHMRMLRFLQTAGAPPQQDSVAVGLHAGELTLGSVPPQHLHDHVWTAIRVAGAQRIGHGVDVGYEHDTRALFRRMRTQDICVEVCLTSNDVILDVTGASHPLPDYLAADVPVTLATDDEGVLRTDLTHEFVRASRTYDLTYSTVKTLSRNSLHYSFLDGRSLWRSDAYDRYAPPCAEAQPGEETEQISASCRTFLQSNPKAAAEWRLERAFHDFETSYRPPLSDP
ncbi:adenosine deaminase [Salinibacter sp.]|uniref:adenosine deaminase n=1 Tax=Salinibacter sp. TaxID=2065818 RepID=UPI0035D45891